MKLSAHVLKVSFLTSVITISLAGIYTEHMRVIIAALLSPLFQVDLDRNGKPDMTELKDKSAKVFGYEFPVGTIIFSLTSAFMEIFVLWVLVNVIYRVGAFC